MLPIRGISALTSRRLIGDDYINEWVDLEPDRVIAILGNNDGQLNVLENSLRLLAKANLGRRIETLLVAEANASEYEFAGKTVYLRTKHEIIQRVALQNELTYVDIHRRLLELYDDGFLWWDRVHLTSYGQRLSASRLY